MLMNKKAQMPVFDFLTMVFAFVIVALIVLVLINNYRTKLDTMTDLPAYGRDTVDKMDNTLYRWFDYGVLILCIGILAFLCINAYQSLVNPIITVFMVILLFLMPFVGIIISKVYSGIIGASTEFTAMIAKMPFTGYIMENLGLVIVICLVLIGIFYIIKPQSSGELLG